jgi:hypothetical protein
MMADVEELLARINAEKRTFRQTVWPPASPAAIAQLHAYARDTLRTDLPAGYIAFLQQNDGLDFNGCVIYGATEHETPFLSGFAETNERLADPEASYVFYGETGHELYVQDRAGDSWLALDRPSFEVNESFPGFDAMLEHVLRNACET